MTPLNWYRRPASPRAVRPRRAFRPALEQLEDRRTPAPMMFTVTNTGDLDMHGQPVPGSLRQAILDANRHALQEVFMGETPGQDTINFNISGARVQTISPTAALPPIQRKVLIDGYSQPGAAQATATSRATLKI